MAAREKLPENDLFWGPLIWPAAIPGTLSLRFFFCGDAAAIATVCAEVAQMPRGGPRRDLFRWPRGGPESNIRPLLGAGFDAGDQFAHDP